MGLTFYRGNVNLPSGGDPMEAVAEALRERRLRQQQIQDEERRRAGALDQQRQIEQMTRQRQLEIHDLDNKADMERALAIRKDAQAAQLEAQRKAVPGIQTALGKGNADAARAAAVAAGIEDFGEATPQAKQIEMGDDAMGMGGALPPPPDPNAKKRYGFSVGGSRQEFELAPPVDNTAAAATISDYLKHTNPAIRRAAGAYRAQIEPGKEQPGRALAKLSTMEGQARGRGGTGSGARASQAAQRGDRRLDLSEEAAARAYAKDILGGLGYKEELGKMRKFSEIASTMTHGNAALDAAAAGTFVKVAQGGTGVISDSDMNQFWHRLGGMGVRGEEGIQAALSGKMGDQKRKIVGDAVKELAGTAQANISQIRGQFRDAYAQSPNLSKYGKQMEAAYFGGAGAQAKDEKAKSEQAPKAAPQNEDEMVEMVMRKLRGEQ